MTDINLTGQIATNLVNALKQPWYYPIINASAGIIGGIFGGVITLVGVWLTQKSNDAINRQNRKHEELLIEKNERKSAYKKFSIMIEKMNLAVLDAKYNYPINDFWGDFATNIAEIALVDLKVAFRIEEVIKKSSSNEDLTESWRKMYNNYKNEVLPLMIANLESQEEARAKSRWRFWK